MSEFKFPTETVELPSKGFFYAEGHPLRDGKVEMRYMTAKDEDILTNQNYIKEGVVLDKLLQSMVVSPDFDLKDLIVGDKNALLVAARILGYGANYTFTVNGKSESMDLSQCENINNNFEGLTDGKNEFTFSTPTTKTKLTFKLLTGHDEVKIAKEIEGLAKVNKGGSDFLTRLRYIITSVNDDSSSEVISEFVNDYFLATDSREFRKHYKNCMPDVDLSYEGEDGRFRSAPIGLDFFWPNLEDSPEL